MANEYFLLFKTAQAEMRAWRNLSSQHKNAIIPIIELTRGRKIPRKGQGLLPEEQMTTLGIFDFKKNIDFIQTDFGQSSIIILDITREPSLISAELLNIKKSDNGYETWRNFCHEIRSQGDFNLIPTLQINPSETETAEKYKENLIKQFYSFSQNYAGIAYRSAAIEDSDFLYDLALLKDKITEYLRNKRRFIVILDHEFIRSGTGILHAVRTSAIIKKLREIVPHAKLEIVILATSFPKSVTELGGQDKGSFTLEEEYLYDEIKKQFPNDDNVYYSDYGSINPVRNDNVGIIRGGWKPRIDFTAKDKRIFYYREKREEGSTYAGHYQSVARKVLNDKRFDEDLRDSWGIKQIKLASEGVVPSSSPSFWIAVRMEIFLQRQIARRFRD